MLVFYVVVAPMKSLAWQIISEIAYVNVSGVMNAT